MHARIAHESTLPNISEAFRTGQVSYSKVRAMTRVATLENEDYLLQIARHGTAAHVERLVCNYRKVQSIAERQRANALHEERYVKFHHDQHGALVIEAVPKNDSAESVRGPDIETLNREQHLTIDAETCVSLWDGTRMDHALAVDALLRCDGALQPDPETGHYPAHFPLPRE